VGHPTDSTIKEVPTLVIDQNIWPIADTQQIEKYTNFVRTATERSDTMRLDWLRERNWVAVPARGFAHFDEQEIDRLVHSLIRLSVSDCLAVPTEPVPLEESLFRFRVSVDGMRGFNWECGHFFVLVTTEDERLAILCSPYDFKLYCGPESIVSLMMGESVSDARSAFVD
jgi:hypothetical protein